MDLIEGRAEAPVSVFLSSAAQDSEQAEVVRKRLDRLGFEIVQLEHGAPGPSPAALIEESVGAASGFLALLSDHYLASARCMAEAAAAIKAEEQLRAARPPVAFIHVLEIAETRAPEATVLSIYAHLNAAGPDRLDLALDELRRRLRPVAERGAHSSVVAGSRHKPPEFRNRREELDKVVNGLTDSGGPHFWLVVAPPQLGKTRFLGQVLHELQTKTKKADEAQVVGWEQHTVDLRQYPDARRDAGRLLALMFGQSEAVPASPEALRSLARDIRRKDVSLLCTLDSAELLEAEAAECLRSCLSKLYVLIPDGRPGKRFGLVIASRSVEEWRGVWPAPRISDLSLTGFTVEIVGQALREFSVECRRQDRPETLARYAASVHNLSEGLPGLLTRCLHWIKDEDWLEMERLDSQELFEELARPYLMTDLLAPHSLFERNARLGSPPSVGSGQPRLALEHAFRVLAPYRFFTLSHLTYCLGSDPGFADAVQRAGWTGQDLLQAISDTALLEQPLNEPWQELHPSIRRLLYRYYFKSTEQRVAAHRDAMDFVRIWSGRQSGREQVIGLVEALWHQAVMLSLSAPAEMESSLAESARKLAGQLAHSESFTAAELRRYAVRRMRDDGELQGATSGVNGLFDRLVAIVGSAAGY
jgi:TIR domain-containing protein